MVNVGQFLSDSKYFSKLLKQVFLQAKAEFIKRK